MLSLFSIPGTTAKLHTDLQVVAEGTVPQDSVMPVQLTEADLADLSGNVPAGVARSDGPPTEKIIKSRLQPWSPVIQLASIH